MTRGRAALLPLTVCVGLGAGGHAAATNVLGSAAGFAVLGAAAVANAGVTTLDGDAGISGAALLPASFALDGMPHSGDAAAIQAESDAAAAFTALSALPSSADLTGTDLGSRTMTPGVYTFSAAAQLTGPLILDFEHLKNQSFVFRIGSTLTTASGATVDVINGDPSSAIYWLVGSSATLGTGTQFAGNILAAASITLATGSSIISGRAIALGAAVTLDTNIISIDSLGLGDFETGRRDFGSHGFSGAGVSSSATPEPQAWALMLVGFGGLGGLARRRRSAPAMA